jgi:hypothetical protein
MAELDLDALLQDDDDFGGLPAFAGNAVTMGRANEDNIDVMSSSMDQVSWLQSPYFHGDLTVLWAEPNAVWLIKAATAHTPYPER